VGGCARSYTILELKINLNKYSFVNDAKERKAAENIFFGSAMSKQQGCLNKN
jgi:hypothetical protein